MTSGPVEYVRFLPFLNEILGGKMAPVVQLNDCGSSFDDILNLDLVSWNQTIWSIVGRRDV